MYSMEKKTRMADLRLSLVGRLGLPWFNIHTRIQMYPEPIHTATNIDTTQYQGYMCDGL